MARWRIWAVAGIGRAEVVASAVEVAVAGAVAVDQLGFVGVAVVDIVEIGVVVAEVDAKSVAAEVVGGAVVEVVVAQDRPWGVDPFVTQILGCLINILSGTVKSILILFNWRE